MSDILHCDYCKFPNELPWCNIHSPSVARQLESSNAMLREEVERYKKALEAIINHQKIVAGELSEYSTTSRIASEALQSARQGKANEFY